MTTIPRTNLVLRIAAGAALLLGAAGTQVAAAQGPAEAVSVDVSECVKLTTPEERLACFEKQTVPNSYLITLDNGQAWRQTVPKYYPLQAGHPVRVYYSKWRSYRLTNDTLKGFIQFERVR